MGQQTLVGRYCELYGLSGDTAVAEAQVHQHFELETALSRELMQSPPADRWGTFERCYNRLYSELPWLVGTGGVANPALWTPLLGPPGASVYEVGSGAGELALALAQAGYRVTATDVSAERGDRVTRPNLTWATTDGVHMDQFAAPGSFDAVISNQLIEHLHPDDIDTHMRAAHVLLKPGGRYTFATPHRLTGPHDVSQVFGLDAPAGMHLREYTNLELTRALRRAGFHRIRSIMFSPRLSSRPIPSRLHLGAMIGLEAGVDRLPSRAAVRYLRGPLRLDIFLTAQRGD